MELLRRLNRPVFALVAVGIIAAGLRFWHLGTPPERIFDEVYYTKDACLYDGYSWKRCGITSSDEQYWVRQYGEVGSWVHPPLGKWAIAIGEKIFGPTPFGWRFSAAVFGTASVVLTALIAQLLFGSALWTFITGLLLATENLNFVQSRTGMLDIFVCFWVVLGFLFLVLDRRWIEGRTLARAVIGSPSSTSAPASAPASAPTPPRADAPGSPPQARPTPTETRPHNALSPFWRPWRFAAGVAFGAALSTKWSGSYAIIGAGLLVLFWEVNRRRRFGEDTSSALGRTVLLEAPGVILAFVAIPALVYVASYTRYWDLYGIHPAAWWKLQKAMEAFHSGLSKWTYTKGVRQKTHPYESSPFGWPLMLRPVLYYFQGAGSSVLGIGNPAIFWGSLVTVPYTAIAWFRNRDWRCGLIVLAILSQWLPWFLFISRVQFFFYVTPITPFMVLAATYVLREISEIRIAGSTSRPFMPVVVSYIVLSVALFSWFAMVQVALPLSHGWWYAHMWMSGWI